MQSAIAPLRNIFTEKINGRKPLLSVNGEGDTQITTAQISDIDTGTADGQILVWSAAGDKWAAQAGVGGGASEAYVDAAAATAESNAVTTAQAALDAWQIDTSKITNVDTGTADGQILVWSAALSKWAAQAGVGGGASEAYVDGAVAAAQAAATAAGEAAADAAETAANSYTDAAIASIPSLAASTFTPVFTVASGSASQVAGSQRGYYMRMGNVVYVQVEGTLQNTNTFNTLRAPVPIARSYNATVLRGSGMYTPSQETNFPAGTVSVFAYDNGGALNASLFFSNSISPASLYVDRVQVSFVAAFFYVMP